MKKYILLSISLLVPFFTFATTNSSDDMMCIQVIQPAISASGECKEFSTPCEVPSEWKKVSSCQDFAEKENSSRIEDNTNRRLIGRLNKLRAMQAENKKAENSTTGNKPNFLRRTRKYVKNKVKSGDTEDKENKYERRGYNVKNWSSKYKRYTSPLQAKAIKERAKKTLQNQEKVVSNLSRKISGTAAITRKLHKSDKRLSNKFFSTQERQRTDRFQVDSDTLKKALRWKNSFRKPQVKRVHTPKTVNLRRTYRGTTQGSLDSTLSK